MMLYVQPSGTDRHSEYTVLESDVAAVTKTIRDQSAGGSGVVEIRVVSGRGQDTNQAEILLLNLRNIAVLRITEHDSESSPPAAPILDEFVGIDRSYYP